MPASHTEHLTHSIKSLLLLGAMHIIRSESQTKLTQGPRGDEHHTHAASSKSAVSLLDQPSQVRVRYQNGSGLTTHI